MSENGKETGVAYNHTSQIKAWGLHGVLPVGIKLPDGVEDKRYSFSGLLDFGTMFPLETINYSHTRQGVRRRHPDANIVSDFLHGDGVVIKYNFRIFSKDLDKRSEYTNTRIELLFSPSEAENIIKGLKDNPNLLDEMVKIKFPEVAERGIKAWKELIYLPTDKFPGNSEEEERIIKILATR